MAAQASPDHASLAADVSETAAALRQWVDTAAEKDYLLLHARVEASASRWVAIRLQTAAGAARDNSNSISRGAVDCRRGLVRPKYDQQGPSKLLRELAAY
jgi:hypothetical protein